MSSSLEQRTFGGGMNSDLALELLPNGKYRYSLNHDLLDDNLLHTSMGNTEITDVDIPLVVGNRYKVIGSKEYITDNHVYFFVFCEQGDNRICRYIQSENKIQTILVDNGTLNFDENYLINSIDFIELERGNLLIYWTDGFNPPRKINVKNAYAFTHPTRFFDNVFYAGNLVGFVSNSAIPYNVGDLVKIKQDSGATYPTYDGYATITAKPNANTIITNKAFLGNTPADGGIIVPSYAYSELTEQTIDAIKWKPVFSPQAFLKQDSSYRGNNIMNKSFQFSTRYVYDDYEFSVKSPYSEVMYANNIDTVDSLQFVSSNNEYNCAVVSFNTGADTVKKIELMVRFKQGNLSTETAGDLYIVKTFDKEDMQLADNSIYQYTFYNDTTLIPISLDEQNLLFDNVPRYSGCQTLAESLNLLYADNTEGFNLPKIDASAIPWVNFASVATGGADYSIMKFFNNPYIYNPPFSTGGKAGNTIELPQQPPQIGSKIKISITGGEELIYQITSADVSSYPGTLYNNLRAKINGLGFWTSATMVTNYQQVIIGGSTVTTYDSPSQQVNVLIKSTGSPSPTFTSLLYPTTSYRIWVIKPSFITPYNPFGSVNDNANVLESVEIISALPDQVVSYPSFKAGARHPFFVVYYDRAGRSTTAIGSDSLVMTTPYGEFPERNFGALIRIKSRPPIYATSYQILYQKNSSYERFWQIAIGAANEVNGNTVLVLSSAQGYTAYDYKNGDRCRFISKDAVTGFTDYVDVAVLSHNTTTQELEIESIASTPLFGAVGNGSLIEIYTPSRTTDLRNVWEISQEYEIINAGTINALHAGNVQSQNTNGATPAQRDALIRIDGGDVYFRRRLMASNVYWIEDSGYTDKYPSSVTNIGRPNVIDDNFMEKRFINSIRYSQKMVLNTFTNRLNNFLSSTLADYNISYGVIKRLTSKERYVRVFFQYKVGAIPINENIQATSTGSVTIQTNSVLNPINYYQGDYGIADNPESLCSYGFSDYFVDINRGAICRVSNNGLDNISQMYGLNQEMRNLSNEIKNGVIRTNIYGSYDRFKNYYVMCFEGKTILVPSQTTGGSPSFIAFAPKTLSFKENRDCFAGYYSYYPENICESGVKMVVFKDGKCYLQDTKDATEYFGVLQDRELHVVFNENPLVEKNQKAIVEETSDIYEMTAIENKRGQDTNLIVQDFDTLGTGYCAAIWKDSNTPNVTDPLFNGDEIKGFVMLGKFKNSSNFKAELKSIGCEQITVLRSGF